MNVYEKQNIKELNVRELEVLLNALEVDAFYSGCENPTTPEDFTHNKSISNGIQEVKDEIILRNKVAVFGKRDIVL
jgi:hypothetical protein